MTRDAGIGQGITLPGRTFMNHRADRMGLVSRLIELDER